jgi:serine/threonine-protein kinase
MVYVAAGEFTMGTDLGDDYEKPAHRVAVKAFFLDQTEVTCREYEKFVRATNRRPPLSWSNGGCAATTEDYPITNVDWNDANAFAQWAGKRLPTEEEWEFAARGSDGRLYPWGNEWRPNAANAGDSSAGRFTRVGSYPEGKSPSGAMDMIGNAWEWTSSSLRLYPGSNLTRLPSGDRKIFRGGSWVKDSPPDWTVTYRGFALPSGGKDYSKVGFRCAKDVSPVDVTR